MRAATSKLVGEALEWMRRVALTGLLVFHLAGPPVPASRPRVSRWGTYYSKTYTLWRSVAAKALAAHKGEPTAAPLMVAVEHIVTPARTTKRKWPRGDVDNFVKATLDAMTKAGTFWLDDDQIVGLATFKRYAAPGEEPGTVIHWFELKETGETK